MILEQVALKLCSSSLSRLKWELKISSIAPVLKQHLNPLMLVLWPPWLPVLVFWIRYMVLLKGTLPGPQDDKGLGFRV